MKFELEVVKFNAVDVITASGNTCECDGCEVLEVGDYM